MTNQPTPETDELIRTQLARVGMTPRALAARLTLKCEQLERERDAMKAEAAKYLQLWDDATKELETLKFGAEKQP